MFQHNQPKQRRSYDHSGHCCDDAYVLRKPAAIAAAPESQPTATAAQPQPASTTQPQSTAAQSTDASES